MDTASEALAVSLAEKARVDMPFMMELTGKTEQEVYADLTGVIFLNPMHGYGSGTEEKYLPADEYLSGNVREKLEWAKRSAELYPEDYAANVQALERVQPADRFLAILVLNIVKNPNVPQVQGFLNDLVAVNAGGAIGVVGLDIALVVGFPLNIPVAGALEIADVDVPLAVVWSAEQLKHELRPPAPGTADTALQRQIQQHPAP